MDLNDDLLEWSWGRRHEGYRPPSAARVVGGHAPLYRVWGGGGVTDARLPGRFRTASSTAVPVVGDWVELSDDGQSVVGTLPRTTLVSRESTSAEHLEQALVANTDVVAVVLLPSHRGTGLLLNFLSVVWSGEATPLVCWGKRDAFDEDELAEAEREAQEYVGPDAVLTVSAHSGAGVADLVERVGPGGTLAFLGPSGVGKSSLINAIAGSPVRRTGGVDRTGQGRHVSSDRALLVGREGVLLVDTPGLRTVLASDLSGIDKGFPDIVELSRDCRFRDCRHRSEPGCAVAAAVEAGELPARRIEEYRKLERDAQRIELRRDARARSEAHSELVVRARKAKRRFRRP